jgi:hypothetical protein
MNWVFSVAAIMVAVAVVLRLLWWAFERSHRLASQRQSLAESPTQLCKTEHGAEERHDK